MTKSKVFGIGFHKTGTTSLAVALRYLGYRVTGPNGVKDSGIAHSYQEKARRISKRFDAFQDNPWPLLYQEMDAMWPNAKFILTVRDPIQWITSQVRHFGDNQTPMRKLIYGDAHGCPLGNEEHYIDVFNRHNKAVRDYFRGRDHDLLEIDLTKNPDWKAICTFLGTEVPEIPFPHSNQADTREKNIQHSFRSPLKIIRERVLNRR